ncbi:MAG: hypothetical protein H7X93_04945 [Sphingomonadaceae bacterium]|nr:hypothetical protein [Sphingomonadaceae bacterium]
MRLARKLTAALGIAAILALPGAARAQDREAPYWASISASRAYMRTGPGRNYPASWLYRRAGLPIRVVEIYENWRKVEDPDGATGWMLVNLLSSERTAMVRGEIRAMHAEPSDAARIVYRVEPGVSGRVRRCGEGWCELDVLGRRGYIRTAHLWGVDANERIR